MEPVLLYFYIHCFSSLSSLSLFEQVKVDCGVSIHIIELESGKFRTRRFIESSLEHGEQQQVQREDNAARFNKERRDSGSVRGERQRSVAPPSAPHLASRADVVDSCRTGSAAEKTGGSSERTTRFNREC